MRVSTTARTRSIFGQPQNRISGFFSSTVDKRRMERPRIGLALGGGGAKGAMHIGVLKALAEANIDVDLIAGTSVGAYIGLLHCAGLSPEEISHNVERNFRIGRWWNIVPGGTYLRFARLIKSGQVARAIERHVRFRNIEDLPKKFVAVSTDLARGESVHIQRGCIRHAISASTNFPGVARPIEHNGRMLVDGGVLENLPAPAARRAGADIVVAVDICGDPASETGGCMSSASSGAARAFALKMKLGYEQQVADADILIQPDVRGIRMTDFSLDPVDLAVRGERAAKLAIPQIYEALTKIRHRV